MDSPASEINFMQIWRRRHEWTAFPPKGYVCRSCLDWIKQEAFEEPLYNDPLPDFTGPRRKWDDITPIAVGIFDGELLGLRCAKIKYGVDAVTEVLQGFRYETDAGWLLKRVTLEDIPETERCSKCWLQLCECNAQEVTV